VSHRIGEGPWRSSGQLTTMSPYD